MEPKDRSRGTRTAFLICILVFLCCSLQARSRGERDFVGFYRIGSATISGSQAQVTLLLDLYNYNDSDLKDATIVLRDPVLLAVSYGSFNSVSIRAHQDVNLSGTFKVPQAEYQCWQKGALPNLFIEFKDAAGKKLRQRIWLMPRPSTGGGQ